MKINIRKIIQQYFFGCWLILLTTPLFAIVDPCNGGSGTVFLLSDTSVTGFSAASIATKTAGQAFSPYIIMYGHYIDGSGNPQCGVNTTYTGTYNINFTNTYVNPSSGTIALLLDSTGGSNFSTISGSSSVAFTNGVGSVTFRYDDVGSIQIGASQGITSGSNSFVVKPADFQITSITPTPSTSPIPIDENSPVFSKAGEPFAVTVMVVNALGVATPNYGLESSPQGVEVYSSQLVSPAGGYNGQNNDGSLLNGAAFTRTSPGVFYNNTIAFDEVGIIQLSARVSGLSYLGTGNVVSSAPSQNVGRFTPYEFTVTPTIGALAPSCSGFSYFGQPIMFAENQKPTMIIYAKNKAGGITKNYDGVFWMLDPPLVTVSSNITNAPVASGSVTFSMVTKSLGVSNSELETSGFVLQPAPNTFIAPTNAEISMTFSVVDKDGVTGDMPSYSFGAITLGDGLPFTSGQNQMRQGRIRLGGANGPVGLFLNMPLSVEYYDGSGFSRNTNDTCTVFTGSNFGLSFQNAYPAGVESTLTLNNNSTVTPAVDSFTEGAGRAIRLSLTPGQVPTPGFVDVVVDVYNTAPWLTYPWEGSLGDANGNPIARAIFGLPAADAPVIFRRESFPGTL